MRKGISDFPKKKTKKKGDSFTLYKTAGIYLEKGKPALPFTNRVVINALKLIKLPGLKELRLKERIDFICSSQTFTVSRTANKWFVAFMLDAQKIPPIFHPIERIGVDLGVKVLATCSDISRKAAVIRIEDLNVSGMKENHKLASAVSNNCFYEIRRQLTYKQPFYATRVELVDRWFPSSKMCCKCGHIQPMGLSERVYSCGGCGNIQDRDDNASHNLRDASLDKIRLA
jgi:transposase